MTNEEKQIKIAEWCGWIDCYYSEETKRYYGRRGKGFVQQHLPPFLASIDAIQQAVLAQGESFQEWFSIELDKLSTTRPIHTLTASEWCDAFLSTVEKIK